jgi:hypothetical protein
MRSRLAEGVELKLLLETGGRRSFVLECSNPVTVYLANGQYSAKKCNKL